MTKVAYNILAYKDPERVARLATRIQTGSDFIRIHFDTMIGSRHFDEWKRIIEDKCSNSNIEVVSEFRCKYGSLGLVEADFSAMKHFEDFDYDYYISLTGDSYPLKPLSIIKNELNKRNCARLEFFRLPYAGWYKGGLHRLNNRFYFIPRQKYPYVWTFSIPRIRKELPCGLKPYGGRGNLCLQKKHATYLLEFMDNNPVLKRFFKRVWGPDEILFQTVLLNSPLKTSIVNEPTMYFDYSEGTSHSKGLTKLDLAKMKRSGKLFGQKFDLEIDAEILDIIDQELAN